MRYQRSESLDLDLHLKELGSSSINLYLEGGSILDIGWCSVTSTKIGDTHHVVPRRQSGEGEEALSVGLRTRIGSLDSSRQ